MQDIYNIHDTVNLKRYSYGYTVYVNVVNSYMYINYVYGPVQYKIKKICRVKILNILIYCRAVCSRPPCNRSTTQPYERRLRAGDCCARATAARGRLLRVGDCCARATTPRRRLSNLNQLLSSHAPCQQLVRGKI